MCELQSLECKPGVGVLSAVAWLFMPLPVAVEVEVAAAVAVEVAVAVDVDCCLDRVVI